ncbi:MAG TPA: rRNA maturation RNase YbeY [Panacibacter sp.]|nr:rRNA maturation RNase YbeY [Panacibacter sp.]HNP44686.1 rRNA maturation RNase YbeY [Panacibacter sp.]
MRKLKIFINNLFENEKKKLNRIDYIFCSDSYLLNINRQFLDHDFYTDIITFELSQKTQPTSAEIYISVERVKENSHKFKTTFEEELLRVIFHGALHLCGYKDKDSEDFKVMRAKENYYITLFLASVIVSRETNTA